MGKKFWRKNIIIKRFFKKSTKPAPPIKSTPNTRPIGWSIPSYPPNKNTNKNTNIPTDNISITILSEPDYYYYYYSEEEYAINFIYPISYPNDNFDKFLEAGSDSKSSN